MASGELALIPPPATIWRVGRPPRVFSWRRRETSIVPAESVDPRADGGRWDDPDGKWSTLYCGDSPSACAFEVLAPLHPDADIIRKVLEATSDDSPDAGFDPNLHTGERYERDLKSYVLASVEVIDPAPFIDVAEPLTHRLLTLRLPHLLRSIDAARFDRQTVMHPDRSFTRAIAGFLRAHVDASDLRVAGIRYDSRVAQHSCYALWEDRLTLGVEQHHRVTRDTAEFRDAAAQLGIAIVPEPRRPLTGPTG